VFPFSFRKGSRAAFISHVSEAAWAAGEQARSKPEQTGSAGRASLSMNQGDCSQLPRKLILATSGSLIKLTCLRVKTHVKKSIIHHLFSTIYEPIYCRCYQIKDQVHRHQILLLKLCQSLFLHIVEQKSLASTFDLCHSILACKICIGDDLRLLSPRTHLGLISTISVYKRPPFLWSTPSGYWEILLRQVYKECSC